MKLSFYYWGMQCPLHSEILRLLDAYENRLEISRVDITGQPDVAWAQRMFFPMLTVVDNTRRYFSPLNRDFLESVCRGNLPEEEPYRPTLGGLPVNGQLEPLTEQNICLTDQCTGCQNLGREKAGWLRNQGITGAFGIVNRQGNRLLGGAEFVPSAIVPYDVPKRPDTAFLTCLYGSEADHQSGPLCALEQMLRQDYRRLIAVTDEDGVFPNGNLAVFLRNGYQDLGCIRQEPGYCRLHLVEKELR